MTWSMRWLSTSITSKVWPAQVTLSVRLGTRRSIVIRKLQSDAETELLIEV